MTDMPETIYATPRGSGTMSGVYVDFPLGDEPRGEHKYHRHDKYEALKQSHDRLVAILKNIHHYSESEHEDGSILINGWVPMGEVSVSQALTEAEKVSGK
jgi:hypothetical protein